MKDLRKFMGILLIPLFFIACSKDDNIDTEIEQTPDEEVTLENEANEFTWDALNFWYFWQGEVANLADSRNDNQEAFYQFLNNYIDPIDLFNRALRFPEDRFTFITDDYTELVQSQQGVAKTNGLEYGLARFVDNNDVYGYVRYIIEGSDAATKDIQRGDVFLTVDGTQLTVDNFEDLLFGENNTYTLGLADVNGNDLGITGVPRSAIQLNGQEVTLTQEENITENPIHVSKVLDVEGMKIGYLMYNRFTRTFDAELNDVFGEFLAAGVTDLVLDLRYNPGGSVNSAVLLSSMIHSTDTQKLFIRQRWNEKVQAQLSDAQLEEYFADVIDDQGTPVNTLELNRVYVLTTGSSASASELVINGLDPYMTVEQIGGLTRGKNEFSITLVDNPDNFWIYNPDTADQINPDNSWGLQPLTGRNENSAGFFDYTNGLQPEYELSEDVSNLGVLGDPSEPFLARALELITGVSAKPGVLKEITLPVDIISSSSMARPMKDNMYLEKVTFKKE
ncbi:S41 family peptidase [Robertkochia aurantiaca]|uniref:S41 family peptidase n=1 Tax=Robertkochia aurantiaca TaxID=2873700 RepID=UPI001CCF2DDC|nr:S41 family peptidase [Robertkochia sp. 3YJGBD-33]